MSFDTTQYLQSGIIENYCLGSLSESEMKEVLLLADQFPEIQKAILEFQNTLEKYAQSVSKPAPIEAKNKLMSMIDNLLQEESISLTNLPLISKYSNSEHWLKFAKSLLPDETKHDVHVKVLRDDAEVFLSILWLKTDVPNEVHSQETESFLVLEGECECFVGDERYVFGPGDFFEVPMYMDHDVKLLTPSVVAVLQRVAA